MERFYRNWIRTPSLVGFDVKVEQTDLFIQAERDLSKEALGLVLNARYAIEEYISKRPGFLSSLVPIDPDPLAPPIVQRMLLAAQGFGVGPMAAVAGAIAQYVAEGLMVWSNEVIVENGGDIYAVLKRDITVGLYGANPRLDNNLCLLIERKWMPVAICTSSSKIGHSLSLGRGDIACVIAKEGAMADAAATLAGNLLKRSTDIEVSIGALKGRPGILGVVLVVEGKVGIWGDVKLVALDQSS